MHFVNTKNLKHYGNVKKIMETSFKGQLKKSWWYILIVDFQDAKIKKTFCFWKNVLHDNVVVVLSYLLVGKESIPDSQPYP